jgi:integrase
MPLERLTDRFVEQATCPTGKSRVRFYDATHGAPRGFGLLVTANGARSWYLWGTSAGERAAVSLGKAGPGGINVALARKAAGVAQGKLHLGQNPTEAKRANRQAAVDASVAGKRHGMTVLELMKLYVDRKQGQLQERTTREYSRMIGLLRSSGRKGAHLPFDGIATRPITSLVRAEIVKWHAAESKRGPFQADKALAILRAAFRFAMAEESAPGVALLDRDPSIGVSRSVRPQERARAASLVLDVPAESVAWALAGAFWKVTTGLDVVARTFLRALILLGLRSGEAKALTWADVDLEGDVPLVRVPARVRKGGKTKLSLPLPKQAAAELRELKQATDTSKRVFADVHLPTVAINLKAATELPWIRFHDLRRSLASGVVRMGYPPHIASQLLGHAGSTTPGVLAHYVAAGPALRELGVALQAFADRIEVEARQTVKDDLMAAREAARAWIRVPRAHTPA